jgi:WD40 repeat protein
LLASAGSDRTVRLWDVVTGEEVRVLEGSEETIYALAFSPDGALLATGGLEEIVRIWDVAMGEKRARLPGHWPATNGVSFSRDGKTLAAGVGDRYAGSITGEVKLWDVATEEWKADLIGTIQRTEGWPQGSVWSLSYAPDGQLLAVGTGAQNIVLWDVSAEKVRSTFQQGTGVRALAFSPDSWTVASAAGYAVKLWDLTTGAERAEIHGHHGWIWSVAFSPDGHILVTGSSDRTTRLWEVPSGRQRAAYDWHAGKIHSVAFALDGMTAAAGAENGTVLIWDIEVG